MTWGREGAPGGAEYRDAASRICRALSGDLRVNPHGLVQPAGDGAYVECVLFVRDSAVVTLAPRVPVGGPGDAA